MTPRRAHLSNTGGIWTDRVLLRPKYNDSLQNKTHTLVKCRPLLRDLDVSQEIKDAPVEVQVSNTEC